MSELKIKQNDGNVKDFLRSIEDKTKQSDCFTLLDIMKNISGKIPKMWGDAIVGFDKYTYSYSSGKTGNWMRIAFSPRKSYISVYVMPGYDEDNPLFQKLGKYKAGKCCINIKKLSDINLKILEEIIQNGYEKMEELYPTKK
ncbi:DUF1801 domain-containing protein [Candidatus Gracilibacteria bacterium]|nr:DUF1801 domain-containing protein [Candidatus Gracilibacteria bacterium]